MSGFINRIILTAAVALVPQFLFAATTTGEKETSGYNFLLIGLVSFILLLLIVIAMLGNVLRQLALVYSQKLREKKSPGILSKIILLLLAVNIPFTHLRAEEVVPAQTHAPDTVYGIAAGDFYLLAGVAALEMAIIIGMLLSIRTFVSLLSDKPETAAAAKEIVRRSFFDRFNKAVAIEEEQDIMLDHNYDGIRELDNSLPPWWKYGFYLTIVIAVIYLYYYHMGGGGPSSYDEYVAEVSKGEADKAAYLSKSANNIDENTIKMLDASGIAAGQTVFQNVCAACHAKDGGGGVGPNLTDDYWLHGGSLKDIFKTIKYGWPDKGMKSWKDDFSPKQLAELASYVKSINGTRPAAPKDKQGTIYIESNNPQKDSTKTVATN